MRVQPHRLGVGMSDPSQISDQPVRYSRGLSAPSRSRGGPGSGWGTHLALKLGAGCAMDERASARGADAAFATGVLPTLQGALTIVRRWRAPQVPAQARMPH